MIATVTNAAAASHAFAKAAQEVAALNSICPGWGEATTGGMVCSSDPRGGIIDSAIVSREWFVIFNDSRAPQSGYESREDAIEAFAHSSLRPA
jgi:hypothetical protein